MLLCYNFLFYFLIACYAEDIFSKSDNQSQIVKINKYGDFEVFTNLTEFEAQSKNYENDRFINTCGINENPKKFGYCTCEDIDVSCYNLQHNLNIKATAEDDFIGRRIFIHGGNVSTLEKGKIFPENAETIEMLLMEATVIQHIEDGAFNELSSLENLELKYIGLKHIDENVLTEKVGRKLKTFTFSFNRMSSFDPTIFKNLINLEKLDLSGSHISDGKAENKFPESLSKLKFLILELCDLNYLNENVFENLRSLEYLNLNYNNFTSIPSAIKMLSNLKTLNFGVNPMEKYEKNSFEGNTNLEKLFLSFNGKLKSIEDCAFCKLPNLKVIEFKSCRSLSYIHENAFGAVSNGYAPDIKEFSIESCNVTILPEKLLNWKNVNELFFNNNLFACNCSNAWLFKDLLSNNSIYESRLSFAHRIYLRAIYHHKHKYTLGCLGPPPTTPNHIHPLTIVEMFASCDSTNDNNYF